MMRSEIKTENLILRKYEIDFIPLLFEAANESKGGEFSRWMPWCHENYAIKDSREFIEKTVENWKNAEDAWREDMQFGYAIFDAETEKFLGGAGLNQPSKVSKMFNLGYWIRTSEQNRGIASRATRTLARSAFEDLPELNRIEIVAAVENIPSQKAAEKSGATREGILRKRLIVGGRIHDGVMFSLVREDFQN
jgi:RimJ/RimL family protein N-acetyltransferase